MISAYSELLPYIEPELSGCPTAMVTQSLQRMGRRFCTTTGVWQKELAAISIVADQAEYGLDPAEVTDAVGAQPEPEVRKIMWAKISDAYQDTDTYELVKYSGATLDSPAQTPQYSLKFLEDYVPTAAITSGLVVKVTLVPNWNSTYISSYILSAYGLPLASGVLWDLMSMPGKPWYNPERARYHFDLWNDGITDGVKERYAGRVDGNLRINLTLNSWI